VRAWELKKKERSPDTRGAVRLHIVTPFWQVQHDRKHDGLQKAKKTISLAQSLSKSCASDFFDRLRCENSKANLEQLLGELVFAPQHV
jgi:hypothetical protein